MSAVIIKKDNHIEDINLILDKLSNVPRGGIVHIGAHKGEEVGQYLNRGFSPILLIEANPSLYQFLLQKFESDKRIRVFNCAISDVVGSIDFYIHQSAKGNQESASILPMAKFKSIVKTMTTAATIKVPSFTLPEFFITNQIVVEDYNILISDIQGADYLALKGAAPLLKHFSAVITEVLKIELYDGAALEDKVDELLAANGFQRKFTIYHELYDEAGHFPAWGEAVFQNKAAG